MRLLVRTWNVCHGRTLPPTGRAHLERMVRLVTDDRPDVVCLQEVPVWALAELERWSGATAVGAVTARPAAGRLAARLTDLAPDRIRSALAGQANAILLSSGLRINGEPRALALNPRSIRSREGRRLGLPRAVRGAWASDRRVAQILRVAAGERTVVVVNVHLTSLPDSRPADAELLRAATYADGFATPGEPLVLAGDLNLTPASSTSLERLATWGFARALPGVDQILARGPTLIRRPEAWPDDRRRLEGGALLSDHAPVEAEMMVS